VSLFDEIQDDILSTTPLSSVLRKAKVLAYRLENSEFKDWVENELNGYKDDANLLPEYRKLQSQSHGHFYNTAWRLSDVPIPPNNIPAKIRGRINIIYVVQGVKELESQIETLEKTKEDKLVVHWPPNFLPALSGRVYANMECLNAWRIITKGSITGIIENTRNRLLTFILELAERYPEEAIEGFKNSGRRIPSEQISQVFHNYIMGGTNHVVNAASISEGDKMAIFDQRNQKVNYQYNAAGDINFEAVQDRAELREELEKLKAELSKAAAAEAIDAEIITDAEYQLTKAIRQTQKPEPDKQTILTYINGAKTVIEGVASAAGIATALVKAGELVQHLF
jgi:hypothetical protein